MRRLLLLLLGVAVAIAGCTASGSRSAHSSAASSASSPASDASTASPATSASSAADPAGTGLVDDGAVTTRTTSACPLVGTSFTQDTIGMRLGRITVQKTSSGRPVGCRIYPQAAPNADCGTACFEGENLPPANQPVVEITTARYQSAAQARDAFILDARGGTNPQDVQLGSGAEGVCFQTDFYVKDRGTDWACATSVGTTKVLVRTVITNVALNAATVTGRVLRGL